MLSRHQIPVNCVDNRCRCFARGVKVAPGVHDRGYWWIARNVSALTRDTFRNRLVSRCGAAQDVFHDTTISIQNIRIIMVRENAEVTEVAKSIVPSCQCKFYSRTLHHASKVMSFVRRCSSLRNGNSGVRGLVSI